MWEAIKNFENIDDLKDRITLVLLRTLGGIEVLLAASKFVSGSMVSLIFILTLLIPVHTGQIILSLVRMYISSSTANTKDDNDFLGHRKKFLMCIFVMNFNLGVKLTSEKNEIH